MTATRMICHGNEPSRPATKTAPTPVARTAVFRHRW
jgi:hypothetical protein